MRATNLQFRSPKERTPGPNHPQTTSTGTTLFSQGCGRRGCSFAQEKRFGDYEERARRTGMRVGPGAYEVDRKEQGQSGCVVIGDQAIYEAGLLPSKRSKLPTKGLPTRPDPFHRSSSLRPKSAKTRTPSSARTPTFENVATPDKFPPTSSPKKHVSLRRLHLEARIDRLLDLKTPS